MSDNFVNSVIIYACIVIFWGIIVCCQDYDSYLGVKNISEKISIIIFWPIYLILWLLISVPKMFFKFAKEQIEK